MWGVSLTTLCLLFSAALSASLEYSYSDQEAWNDLPNSQCDGTTQSPVNIVTDDLNEGTDIGLESLVFSYLSDEIYGTWTNNGHSVTFTPVDSADTAARTVTTYRGDYELLQFHFHWGRNNMQGSEHTVDGKQYAGELHFVHQTTNDNVADTDFDYYTVIGVLLVADDDMEADGTIFETLSDIPGYEETININPNMSYYNLLPNNGTGGYYHYNGSLTTPLCDQIVQWVLLKTPMSVPSSFFAATRMTEDANEEDLTFNFRDVQPLNTRNVYDSDLSAASSIIIPCTTLTLLLVSIFVTIIY